jgi:hypothetical protein
MEIAARESKRSTHNALSESAVWSENGLLNPSPELLD